MTQQEKTRLQRLIASLPSTDIRVGRDQMSVVVYDPVNRVDLKLAYCHSSERAELLACCVQATIEAVA